MQLRSLPLVVALAGCSSENFVVEKGYIEFVDSPVLIEAPATATVGSMFPVVVTTYGGGCTTFEETALTLAADSASITPYDRERIPSENEGCTLRVNLIPHSIQLKFESTGMKRIVIYGRRAPGGTAPATDVSHELYVYVE